MREIERERERGRDRESRGLMDREKIGAGGTKGTPFIGERLGI